MGKTLKGIDISSHQAGIDLTKVPCDFVIIKATQGTNYINPDLERAYKQAKSKNKLIGLYHYASKGGSSNEAKHFIDTVKKIGAIGNAILILDWEGGSNENWGNVSYAHAFLAWVRASTGVTPFIYMSKQTGCRGFDWKAVADYYPLWAAQYANYIETGYQNNPWTDAYSWGAWDTPYIYQYSSAGKLKGWDGHLDLNICYISKELWKDAATPGKRIRYPKNQESSGSIDTSKYPVLKLGNRNLWVKLLQNCLTVRGYSVASDGIFGPLTQQAVILFQIDRSLKTDGIVGQQTWKALVS